MGYVQAMKNAIIWDKKVVTTKTIRTLQVETCSGPIYINNRDLAGSLLRP